MRLSFAAARPEGAFDLAILSPSGGAQPPRVSGLDPQDEALAAAAVKAARFEGEAGAIAELFARVDGESRRLLVTGAGAGSIRDLERVGAALTARLLTSGAEKLVVDLTGATLTAESVASLATGLVLRGWRYDVYRTKLPAKAKPTLDEIVIVGAPEGSEAAWEIASAVAEGVAFTRELVTEPANILYPESFVERCLHLRDLGVEIEVLDEPAMRKLGMGALLGVAQGSRRAPRLLVMRWDGTGGAETSPVAFVGKGVTFDTGGISIKPAAGMEDMKWDMGGAGAVAGAIKALALRKANAHIVGVCGLVENMPDGDAQRPGDVVTSMSGQTIEVINTDAEGRLVLCDALTWVQQKYAPKTIVDLATLTGAMIISLGSEHGGLFSNDDSLADELLAAGKAAGDPLWRFPLSDAYNKLIDSPIADMKNVGPRGAGSITAAQFLKRYIHEGVRWAHLDIAGMVWADKPGAVWDKGATGFGVRLLDRFVADNFEK
ncbi:MAG: leucyl aminopeptidase [Sphingomonas sanxanigenens]|uniref:Probable cytosol aminopeptidase n=1 Tax=Sphingomonas sanxanigenens TaxID=397260 RepID=A0A2W5A5B4_9SPHN|nr:MAG: leucyl aminopeptidase [Sphingomonas sanxanigenens]